MAKFNIREALQFKDLTPEEKERRGILGRLFGPVADIIRATRNGRKYDDNVWTNVFNNDIVKELIEAGGIPGEMDHPADRQDVCSEKIAIMMPEAPKKDPDGHLIGYFDILDTPCGRIAYQLAKYGFHLGISSRGSGETYEDDDGNESVDPNNYDFTCFDLVLIPSVKDARLQLVEGLDSKKRTLKQALKESLNTATEADRKIMENTLKDLDIDLEEPKASLEGKDEPKDLDKVIAEVEAGNKENTEEISEDKPEESTNIEKVENLSSILAKFDEDKAIFLKIGESEYYTIDNIYSDEDTGDVILYSDVVDDAEAENELSNEPEANDVGADLLIDLQESLKKNSKLEAQVLAIQEKLAVSDTKVATLKEQLNTKESTYKDLSSKIKTLSEQLTVNECTIKSQNERIDRLVNAKKESIKKNLDESIADKTKGYEKQLNESASKISKLEADLKEAKTLQESRLKEYKEKIAKGNTILEQYRKRADDVVERYIESKARMLGVTSNEIKNKLSNKYSIDDIDSICESLQDFTLNVSKLPFNLTDKKTKVKITESKNDNLHPNILIDDDIDDFLLTQAGKK